MDNASVISLSSSSSEDYAGSYSLASVITVSSEAQLIPVIRKNGKELKKKETILDIGDTPDHAEKVNNWMKTCNYDEKNTEDVENKNDSCQSTCIRYDFDKNTPTVTLPKSCFTRETPLFDYMEESKKNLKNAQQNGSKVHKNRESVNTPLSPETRKTELCNYLQLMKPSDKAASFFVEYRRSVRVKSHKEMKEASEKTAIESSQSENTVLNGDSPPSKLLKKEESVCDLKLKKDGVSSKLLPLPPKKFYVKVVDFEDSVKELVEEDLKRKQSYISNECLKKVDKRRKFIFGRKLHQKWKNKKNYFSYKRINLRSRGRLRNISLDNIILRKTQLRKKARKKLLKEFKEKLLKDNVSKPDTILGQESPPKSANLESPRCEIISVHTSSDDENIDLKNFVDDMLELDKMSAEHRKSVIETRILASSSITNLINKRVTQEADLQRAYKIFSDLSNERKSLEEKENTQQEETKTNKDELHQKNLVMDVIISEHDYANFASSDLEEDKNTDQQSVANSMSPVPMPDLEVLPVSNEIEMKSLHRSLTTCNKRKLFVNNYGLHNWNSDSSKKLNHCISILNENGSVLHAFYQDHNLIVAQQKLVSFWTQSALGNVLGAQNMWIPKGKIQRITLNSKYTQKHAVDMVITTETNVAFVELWTKEHKSDVREVPLADVFATVYFWRLRQNGLEKKALQLENIQGFADDVQYCVLKSYSRIVVSWHCIQGTEKKTKIHSYHLATDFQTVANISEIQPINHYVSSLHNIEDGDGLVMGCGDNKITLWNVEYGYIVATIEMSTIKSPLSTHWVKCDRGFLFTIQECVDQELRLIAINGMNHSWKKLQSYNPSPGFDRLKGVCIDNGILVAYYSQGILCWNAQTGELIVEEVPNECEYIPCGKHVIMIVNENIIVRHSLSHLITDL